MSILNNHINNIMKEMHEQFEDNIQDVMHVATILLKR